MDTRSDASGGKVESDAAKRGAWTFMVYMAGNNNLSEAAGTDLEELRRGAVSPAVRVFTFIKQQGESGDGNARRIEVRLDGKDDIEQLGDVDSGDPQTIVDFIRWAVAKAPADHYALVLWNHGSGWRPDDLEQLYSVPVPRRALRHELAVRTSQTLDRLVFKQSLEAIVGRGSVRERAIASDDGTGHSVDTLELENVVRRAQETSGQKFSLLGMDACLMSTLEVAYQVRDLVDVVVGSEELEPNAGWNYDGIVGKLSARPETTPPELGALVVNEYVGSYRDQRNQWPVTQVALSMSAIGPFATAFDRLVDRLRATVRTDVYPVLTAYNRSVGVAEAYDMDLIDLRSFCLQLREHGSNDLVQAADGVIDGLVRGSYVIAEDHLGEGIEETGGIAVYFPGPRSPMSKYYSELAFAQRHHWDEFLSEFRTAVRAR
jgi:Clostripain family